MLKNDYKSLNPSKLDIIKIKIKTLLAGIIPWRIMFAYHKRIFKNKTI